MPERWGTSLTGGLFGDLQTDRYDNTLLAILNSGPDRTEDEFGSQKFDTE
jgi:hypothetical protein